METDETWTWRETNLEVGEWQAQTLQAIQGPRSERHLIAKFIASQIVNKTIDWKKKVEKRRG